MFGIGLPEFILIMIVGLIVFGPGKLPEIGRALGKGLREFRKAQATFSAAMNVTESVQPAHAAKAAVKAAASAAVAPPSGGAPEGSVAALAASASEAGDGGDAPMAERAQEEEPQEKKQEDKADSPSLSIEARPTEVADGYKPPTAEDVQKAVEAQQQKPQPRPSVARPFVPEMEPVTTSVKPKKLKKHKKAKKDKKKKK